MITANLASCVGIIVTLWSTPINGKFQLKVWKKQGFIPADYMEDNQGELLFCIESDSRDELIRWFSPVLERLTSRQVGPPDFLPDAFETIWETV